MVDNNYSTPLLDDVEFDKEESERIQKLANSTWVCPHCLSRISTLLPVEPLYSLPVAAGLIPTSLNALRAYLSRNNEHFPQRRYRKDRQRRRHRLLTASEIRYLRKKKLTYRGPKNSKREPDEIGN